MKFWLSPCRDVELRPPDTSWALLPAAVSTAGFTAAACPWGQLLPQPPFPSPPQNPAFSPSHSVHLGFHPCQVSGPAGSQNSTGTMPDLIVSLSLNSTPTRGRRRAGVCRQCHIPHPGKAEWTHTERGAGPPQQPGCPRLPETCMAKGQE